MKSVLSLVGALALASATSTTSAPASPQQWAAAAFGGVVRAAVEAGTASFHAGKGLHGMMASAMQEVHTQLAPMESSIRAAAQTSAAARRVRAPPAGVNPLPDGYYRVIPEYVGAVPFPKGGPVLPLMFNSTCFSRNTVIASVAGAEVTLSLNAAGPLGNASCTDFYLVGVVNALNFLVVESAGAHTVTLPLSDVPAGSLAWTQSNGIRVMQFLDDPLTTIGDLLDTVSLYLPSLSEVALDQGSMDRNLQFLKDYANITMPGPRANPDVVDLIDPSFIQTGDFLAIHRLDGLGTLEPWGTGAHTSHTAVFMRLGPQNDLFIVESTDVTSYWPNPNIQKTAFAEWITMAKACSYAVTVLPLKESYRAMWNQSAVEDFLAFTLGLPYGYHNFLWGWVDAAEGNLPWPASWPEVEVLFGFLEVLDPALVTRFVGEAMNLRLGTSNLTVPQLSAAAAAKGLNFGDLLGLPEQDSYVYSDGPSMVCDVFACRVYKAAGLFGALADQINCGEFHNLDVYALDFFDMDPANRPAACAAADPNLPYCQLLGNYQLLLPNAGTTAPYPHMSEHCTAMPPSYIRPPMC